MKIHVLFGHIVASCYIILTRVRSAKEVQHQLCQLELLNGLLTNPNVPGCEKLVTCGVSKSWLFGDPTKLTSNDLGQSALLSPGRLFMVKGYNRCLAALGILWAAWKEPALLEEGL